MKTQRNVTLLHAALLHIISAALLYNTAFAQPTDNSPETRRQLQQTQSNIETITTEFAATRKRYDTLQTKLRKVDIRIGEIHRSANTNQQQLVTQNQTIQKLAQQQRAYKVSLAQQKRQLERDVLASYITGRAEALPLILSLKDPAVVGRTLTYYRYVSEAHEARINAVSTTITQMAISQQRIEHEKAASQHIKQKLNTLLYELKREQNQRQALLAKLDTELNDKKTRLIIARSNEKRLRQKLEELERAALKQAAEAARRKTKKILFTTLKGSLPWPTSGPLVAKFGSSRTSNALRRRGVVIGTQSGQSVHAVANGRVVFADWLKGFGLLLIIDHSEGYLSLYGHNETLLKNVGDAVDQEEMIASTGNSGGQQNAGLYFELRHQGKPINPTQWLRKRG